MPTRLAGVVDNADAANVVDVDVVERPALDLATTTTADPGTSGTSLAVTARDKFPQSGQFKIRVEDEIMYVTAGWGTGAGNFTVVRGQDGTAAVAHASGQVVYALSAVQRVEPVDGSRIVLFKGRAMSFRTPGRAGTTGQKILSLYNGASSPVKVRLNKVFVDVVYTAIIAVTVVPAIIRVYKVTVAPSSGTALIKTPIDSAGASNSNVTTLGDAQSDGSGSTTALAATLPSGAILTEEFAPRLITAAGYEMFDREEFFDSEDEFVTLNAGEGVVLFLEYTVATANAITTFWVAGMEWEEYRVA